MLARAAGPAPAELNPAAVADWARAAARLLVTSGGQASRILLATSQDPVSADPPRTNPKVCSDLRSKFRRTSLKTRTFKICNNQPQKLLGYPKLVVALGQEMVVQNTLDDLASNICQALYGGELLASELHLLAAAMLRALGGGAAGGRGLHSPTSQLNLRRLGQ